MGGLTLENRIKLISTLNLLAALALIASRMIGEKADFLNGFGVGLILVAGPALIYLIIKYNNDEFKTDYNLCVNDERVKRNSEKAQAAGFKLLSMGLLLVAIITYVLEIKMYIFVLGIVLIAMVYVKLYNRKLNKIS